MFGSKSNNETRLQASYGSFASSGEYKNSVYKSHLYICIQGFSIQVYFLASGVLTVTIDSALVC